MFEKEGIKYALEEIIGTECLSKPIEDFSFIDLADEQQEKAQCYKDGAEFGYNKAKEEMQEQGLALQSDMDKTIEQNIQLKKQIEKMKADYDKLLDEKIELEDRLAESRECY